MPPFPQSGLLRAGQLGGGYPAGDHNMDAAGMDVSHSLGTLVGMSSIPEVEHPRGDGHPWHMASPW